MNEIIAVVFVIFVFLYQGVKVIQKNERAVLFRLGRFHGVLRPGIRFIMAGVDKVCLVNLPKHVPEWQSLSPEQLDQRVKDLVFHEPDPKRLAKGW